MHGQNESSRLFVYWQQKETAVEEQDAGKQLDTTPPKELKFHFIKSNHFRVIHIDGVIGGPTPSGMVHAAIFSERFPIPLSATYHLAGNEVKGPAKEMVARDGIVREVESDLLMTTDVARKFAEWLVQAAEKVDKATNSAE